LFAKYDEIAPKKPLGAIFLCEILRHFRMRLFASAVSRRPRRFLARARLRGQSVTRGRTLLKKSVFSYPSRGGAMLRAHFALGAGRARMRFFHLHNLLYDTSRYVFKMASLRTKNDRLCMLPKNAAK
jgi:hypothetical protein